MNIQKCYFCGKDYDADKKSIPDIFTALSIDYGSDVTKLDACDDCANAFWIGYIYGRGLKDRKVGGKIEI